MKETTNAKRLFIRADYGFAIDLAEVVCVSRYYDEDHCKRCNEPYTIDRMSVYTRNDMQEGFCLDGSVARELIEAWAEWIEQEDK